MKKCVYISVLFMAATAMSDAANKVPYEETFESYAAGFELPGTNGWSAAAPADAVVSTNAASIALLNAYSEPCGYPVGTANHAKVLQVAATVTNSFDMASSDMVWVDVMLEAGAPDSVGAGLLSGAHAATYFNSGGHPMVYHYDSGSSSNRWTEIPEVTKTGWVRATIGLDYQTDYFQIKMDGNLLTNALGNTSSDGSGSAGGSWFAMPTAASQLNKVVLDGPGGRLDDLVVTTLDPFKPAIASFDRFSGDVFEMVVDFPVGNQLVLPSAFSPIKSTDLIYGTWDGSIMHSTNGVDGWRDTSLDYSADLGSGRRVIYLQSTNAVTFFSLEKN